MPDPYTPCGRATPQTALRPFGGWPTRSAGGLRPSSFPLDTPSRTGLPVLPLKFNLTESSVIRRSLRGHDDKPFEWPTPRVGQPQGVFGAFSYYQLVMLFLKMVCLTVAHAFQYKSTLPSVVGGVFHGVGEGYKD
jgi:hypothetical protein